MDSSHQLSCEQRISLRVVSIFLLGQYRFTELILVVRPNKERRQSLLGVYMGLVFGVGGVVAWALARRF